MQRTAAAPPWPVGGGELGDLIRAHDWRATALGPIDDWPQSLRTATDILLRAAVPMVMLWGADGVMIYNDAYARFSGDRHPGFLGAPVRAGWPEVADFNDNVMKVGLSGETLSYRDQELTLHRGRGPEQVWMNLDYSPVLAEDGRPSGVLSIVIETTERVLAERALAESEIRSREVLSGMGDAFLLLDPAFRVREINAAALRIEGRPASEILGRSHWDVWPGTEDSLIGQLYKRAMAERIPLEIEHDHVFPDGRSAWMQTRASPSGNGLAVFYRDMTEQRRATQALGESEARFRDIANSIDQMVWSTRPDGYHDFYNQRWYDYTGVPEGTTDGERWNGMFHPDDRERAWARWRRSLATGELYQIEYRLRHRSGEYRWVLGRAQPVRDEEGAITRWYGTCTDIHDHKLAEDALLESRDQLAIESHALEILNRTGTQVAAEAF